MLSFDLSEQFGRLASARFANLYFLSAPPAASMGYDNLEVVGEVHWVRDTPADYPLDELEDNIAADPDHDPERVTIWGVPVYTPGYKKYTVAGLTPVDVEGRHVATIGTDALMDELVASVVESEIPGATHAIFGGDGRLIADRVHLAKVIKSERRVSIADTGDRRLLALLELVRAQATLPASGFDRESDAYYAVSRIEGPGWYFGSTVSGALVRSDAFRSAQWVLWTGIASLALLLAILALILRRQIGKPLQQLLAATLQMRERKALLPLDTARRDELGRLARAFVDTAESIESEFRERAETLRRAKEEADAASEAKSRFLAHMSHELRTPLNAILGYAQILERDATLSERQRNGVAVMHRSGEHLLGLINDILDLSKVEFQKLDLQPHDFSLRDFLEGIAATFAVRAREKGLRYRQSSDPNLPPYVHGDEQRLRQVLFNLIGNAVKFTDHGEVVVGDIQSLLDEAHTLEPNYPPFAQELRVLAQGFQVKRICRWLEGHGACGTTQPS